MNVVGYAGEYGDSKGTRVFEAYVIAIIMVTCLVVYTLRRLPYSPYSMDACRRERMNIIYVVSKHSDYSSKTCGGRVHLLVHLASILDVPFSTEGDDVVYEAVSVLQSQDDTPTNSPPSRRVVNPTSQ